MTDTNGFDDVCNDSQAEQSLDGETDYERAMRKAFALMEEEFRLGGVHKLDRDTLHDYKAFRESEPH